MYVYMCFGSAKDLAYNIAYYILLDHAGLFRFEKAQASVTSSNKLLGKSANSSLCLGFARGT